MGERCPWVLYFLLLYCLLSSCLSHVISPNSLDAKFLGAGWWNHVGQLFWLHGRHCAVQLDILGWSKGVRGIPIHFCCKCMHPCFANLWKDQGENAPRQLCYEEIQFILVWEHPQSAPNTTGVWQQPSSAASRIEKFNLTSQCHP